MLSRRGHRLSRFRKNKRRLRERLRQRIFFRLELSNQVQRFFEVNFIRCFPT